MGIFKRRDSPNWWYRAQLRGRIITGSTDTLERRLAYRIYLEKHRQLVEDHHLPYQKGRRTTFFKMCELYIENHAKVNKSSWRDDERILQKLKNFFEDVSLIVITSEDVERYKGSRRSIVKDATINRELTILKAIFKRAVIWGYTHHDPTKDVRPYREERTPVRILSSEERQRLIESAPEFMRPILVMALKTGMRKGEIMSLQWRNVDLEHEMISVTHTKSRKLREVPIHPELADMLKALPRVSEHVFCDRKGRKLCVDGKLRKIFVESRNKAGLPDLTFHALRHNFASELVAKGADLRTVQEYLGHSSLILLQRYAHVSKGIWRSTIQLLGRDVREVETAKPPSTPSAEAPELVAA